ncbi:MAG: adenylate kinase [Actinobacteria bacterium]|nr:adenylate kinase [Actinomycetota bacterium]
MAAPLRILVFGKQGSGKGTLATRLHARLLLPHISTGDMLRAAAASGSEFGQRVAAIMDAGELVSDEVMEGVVEERLNAPDAADGFILDGYPRTPGQAAFLDELLLPDGISIAIELQVADDVVRGRIVNRRVCTSCGAIYAAGRDESAETGVCAACGGTVIQRDDDTEEAVGARLATYAQLTEPLLEYYEDRGLLERISGEGDPEAIADGAVALIEARRG